MRKKNAFTLCLSATTMNNYTYKLVNWYFTISDYKFVICHHNNIKPCYTSNSALLSNNIKLKGRRTKEKTYEIHIK